MSYSHDRTKHEAMLRREMLARLATCPCGDHAEHVAFAEAFVADSRPYHERQQAQPQEDLFE